jgi:hypothetical protein
MNNGETSALRDMILGGTRALPLSPDRPFQQIAVDDVGAFVVMAFERRDGWLGRGRGVRRGHRDAAAVGFAGRERALMGGMA